MEKEDCNQCKYKLKNDNGNFCHMFKDYPDFKFPKECGYLSSCKPFLSGHVKFKKRDNEIIIVPIYKGRELI